MPELPEVETIRRGLAPLVEGRAIARLVVHDARWCAPLSVDEVADAVRGRRVEALRRRGKYLIWDLEDDVRLVTHLRMTGNYLYDAPADQPYRRVTVALSDGHEVGFFDPRRFGTGVVTFGDDG
ncbi:MAG TPA: DNA-formamidopyrimidine glycosylase family protein, partial [Solirubrobacteraceae bacterium]